MAMAMAIGRETHHKTKIPTEDSQLPHDIIFDILLRLSVKSLLRFRSVCKSWLSLISNHQFIKTHLSKKSHKGDDYDDDYTHHRLVLSTRPSHNVTGLKTCSLETLDTLLESQQWESAVDLDYPFKELNEFVDVVGSCNGLMCVATDTRDIYLLNPSTRKSKRLPDLGVKRQRNHREAYGFGFDDSNDDYKVVLILYRGGVVSAESTVMVYALRTDSWRQIGGLSCGIPCNNGSGKFLNGSIVWLVCVNYGSCFSYVIVSLDLEKETYGEVSRPNYGNAHSDLESCVLERCLGLLCTSPKNDTDVWIMKEYGKIDSWTKLFTIRDVARPWLFHTLCISKNGELLILYGQHLIVYSPKNGTSRNLVIQNANHCKQMCTYVESLVSLDANNVVERQHQ